jgi:hypothetical protein
MVSAATADTAMCFVDFVRLNKGGPPVWYRIWIRQQRTSSLKQLAYQAGAERYVAAIAACA